MMQNMDGASQVEFSLYLGDLTQLYRYDNTDLTVVGTGYNLVADSGGAVWDSGTSTWDAGSTTWDASTTKADQWSFTNFGAFALTTNGVDTPQIRKADGNFVNMNTGVTGVTLVSGGTGYTVDDVLTMTGGDGSGATAIVVAVSGGIITVLGTNAGGTGYTTPPTGVSGGTGSGATFTATVCDMDVTTAEIFLTRGPHVMVFNTSLSPREFNWCDADDPDTWATAADNLAGSLQIRELKGSIQAAVHLGDRIAVYGEDQMFIVSYLGTQLVFGYKPGINGIGAVSKKAVVAVGKQNYGLSTQGFFITDGVSFKYIDEPQIHAWYENNVNTSQLTKCFAFHDEENTTVRWYFPTDAVETTVYTTYNYTTGAWSFGDVVRTAGEERVVSATPYSGGASGKIYTENTGYNDGTSAVTAWVRTTRLDLSDADRVKELDSIRLGNHNQGLQFRVGWSEEVDATINWDSYLAIDRGFDFTNIRTAGRWLHMELYSNGLNDDWEVHAMEVIGRIEGTR